MLGALHFPCRWPGRDFSHPPVHFNERYKNPFRPFLRGITHWLSVGEAVCGLTPCCAWGRTRYLLYGTQYGYLAYSTVWIKRRRRWGLCVAAFSFARGVKSGYKQTAQPGSPAPSVCCKSRLLQSGGQNFLCFFLSWQGNNLSQHIKIKKVRTPLGQSRPPHRQLTRLSS